MSRVPFVLSVLFLFTAISYAQGLQLPEPPLPVDPRPLAQLISAAEKASLADNNPKKLVEAYLKISDTHLQAAFDAIRVNNHLAAERELDIYNKAVAAAGKQAFGLQEGKRNVSKKIEQVLYRQIKTLESIDRLFPSEREPFSDAALKHAKQLRVQALNEAFASGDVLKDPDEEKKPKSDPPKNEAYITPKFLGPLVRGTRALHGLVGLRRSTSDSDAADSRTIASYFNPTFVPPQIPGDYLTEEEDNHVREAQAADDRVKVFMRIAERRIKAVVAPAAQAADKPAAQPADKKGQKKIEEEEREWGKVPNVNRAELLRHYARAIAECMAKLEDAYERNPKSSALSKALALLRDSTEKHLQTLRPLGSEMKTESEVAAFREAIDQAETANKGARDGLK